jgi:hypothetical protein
MAYFIFRVNLSNPNFPFATELWGRSIVIPQYDQNFDRTTLNAPGVVIDKGIPQAYYMHNVLPTPQGYQSIGYLDGLPPDACNTTPNNTDFDQAFTLQDPNGNKFLFVPAAGKNYVFDASVGTWQASTFISGVTATTLVTTAFVQGQTYIFYEGIGAFTYNSSTKALDSVTLTGLDIAQVLGICTANGYMVAFSRNNVAWSSLLDPTDFTPDLTTGAGGASINDAKGNIIACLPLSGGFVVYCDLNAVGARYSGNINFPFVFKEVPGSAGIRSTLDVSYHSNLAFHILWDGNGLQQLTLQNTTQVYPEAADFLAGQIFEDFDEDTNSFTTTYLQVPPNIAVTIISARFLVISYGIAAPDFTHALVYDLLLNRWGKLKITHRHCFQFTFPNLFGATTYGQLVNTTYLQLSNTTYAELGQAVSTVDEFKHSFAFLQQDGDVQLVDFSLSELNSNGVLLTGKYQLQRAQRVEHQVTEFDGVRNDVNKFEYYIIPTQDGKTMGSLMPPFLAKVSPRSRIYKQLINCYSFSCLMKGQFNLHSMNLTVTQGGYSE